MSVPFSAGGWETKIKVGYRKHQNDKKCSPPNEIKINVERLALLAPFNHMELLWEIAADDAVSHDPETLAATKDEILDALVKDAAANNASGQNPHGMTKQANLGKLGRKGASTQDNDETAEKLKKVTINEAAGHELEKLTKETGLEDVTLHVPRRKTQQSKKRSKKPGNY